jgi:hypothetical protein
VTALFATSEDTEASTHAAPTACATTALTQLNRQSQSCANPFCKAPFNIKSPRGKHERYCSAPCRMDDYALRRAKVLLNRVGIIWFHELLDEL